MTATVYVPRHAVPVRHRSHLELAPGLVGAAWIGVSLLWLVLRVKGLA